jgi:uncharacterized membrane protein YccF (DUF307 family)
LARWSTVTHHVRVGVEPGRAGVETADLFDVQPHASMAATSRRQTSWRFEHPRPAGGPFFGIWLCGQFSRRAGGSSAQPGRRGRRLSNEASTARSGAPAGRAAGARSSTRTRSDRPSGLVPALRARRCAYARRVRLLLNVIWLVFGGLVMALGYAIAALIMLILIITIPFGIAAARMALFCLWPFGRTLVRRSDAGVASVIGNVIWFLLAGWWLALGHLITGVLMCITIIGIPLGLANFKLIPVSLTPLGRDIVDIDELRRQGAIGDVTVGAPPPGHS